MMYSSANLCCFKVSLAIFHHLHFFHNTKSHTMCDLMKTSHRLCRNRTYG
nr:MAG TPA: hypothetical protein [Caudoviricetes sp.]